MVLALQEDNRTEQTYCGIGNRFDRILERDRPEMKRIITALSLSVLLANPANAYQFRGITGMKCDFLNAYHTDATKDWAAVKQWIYGYLSGINATYESVGREDAFSQIYFDAAYRNIRRYCEANPDKQIIEGIHEFVHEVTSK